MEDDGAGTGEVVENTGAKEKGEDQGGDVENALKEELADGGELDGRRSRSRQIGGDLNAAVGGDGPGIGRIDGESLDHNDSVLANAEGTGARRWRRASAASSKMELRETLEAGSGSK